MTLDRYYTPRNLAVSCMKALTEVTGTSGKFWDPHAGAGRFFCAAASLGLTVGASDIDPGAQAITLDFLGPWPVQYPPPDWFVGNPPYTNCEAHIRRAYDLADRGCAFLVKLSLLSGKRREKLYQDCRLRKAWIIRGRPSFDGPDAPDAGNTDRYDYAFLLFDKAHSGPATLDWINWSNK